VFLLLTFKSQTMSMYSRSLVVLACVVLTFVLVFANAANLQQVFVTKTIARMSLEARLRSHPKYEFVSRAFKAWKLGKRNVTTVFTVSNGGNVGNQEYMVSLVAVIALAINCQAVVEFDSTANGVFEIIIPKRGVQNPHKLTFEDLMCRNLTHLAKERNLQVDWAGTFFSPYWLYSNIYHKRFMEETFGDVPFGLMSQFLFVPCEKLAKDVASFEATKLSSCDFVLGIHIRYGNGPSDMYFSIGDSLEIGRKVGRFAQSLIDNRVTKKACIFLATDNRAIRQQFPEFVANTTLIVSQEFIAGPDASTPYNSVFDQELLARSDVMIGTFMSSFSFYPMARGLFAESYWINPFGDCFRSPPDGGIPWVKNNSHTDGFLANVAIKNQEASNTCGHDMSPMSKWLITSMQ
jgi:hypothetical protein